MKNVVDYGKYIIFQCGTLYSHKAFHHVTNCAILLGRGGVEYSPTTAGP